MNTKVVIFDSQHPSPKDMEQAAHIIQGGGLVAFPTETVYGLGANALDESAVKKIYEAKGRPSDNPLIVHISHVTQLNDLVLNVTPLAQQLANAFWPGALTLILPKKHCVPNITTGGLQTVAVRCPNNHVARLLIEQSGLPIAAPSANLSGKPSPTTAKHVFSDMNGRIPLILDGGSCTMGLESTVVDISEGRVVILRPGLVTLNMLETVVGVGNVLSSVSEHNKIDLPPKAPGMKYKHYAPNGRLQLIEGPVDLVSQTINAMAANCNPETTAILATQQSKSMYLGKHVWVMGDRQHPETIASNLFFLLRQCDDLGMTDIFVEAIPQTDVGLAIMNRLQKAANHTVL